MQSSAEVLDVSQSDRSRVQPKLRHEHSRKPSGENTLRVSALHIHKTFILSFIMHPSMLPKSKNESTSIHYLTLWNARI